MSIQFSLAGRYGYSPAELAYLSRVCLKLPLQYIEEEVRERGRKKSAKVLLCNYSLGQQKINNFHMGSGQISKLTMLYLGVFKQCNTLNFKKSFYFSYLTIVSGLCRASICQPFKEPRNRFSAWRNRFLGSLNWLCKFWPLHRRRLVTLSSTFIIFFTLAA